MEAFAEERPVERWVAEQVDHWRASDLALGQNRKGLQSLGRRLLLVQMESEPEGTRQKVELRSSAAEAPTGHTERSRVGRGNAILRRAALAYPMIQRYGRYRPSSRLVECFGNVGIRFAQNRAVHWREVQRRRHTGEPLTMNVVGILRGHGCPIHLLRRRTSGTLSEQRRRGDRQKKRRAYGK